MANRLLTEWAQTAQVGGWMANEAGQHGLSQRYVTSGLHAVHTAGDRTVGVHLLAFASTWRVIQGGLNDGVDLGRAARDAAELANAAYEVAKSTPPAPRALAASATAAAQVRWATRTASTPPLARPAPCSTPQQRWTLSRPT